MRRCAPALLLCLSACSGSVIAPAPGPPAVESAPVIAAAPASASAPALSSAAPEAPPAEPKSAARALREGTLATSRALDTVRSLADEAGPRLSGSPGNKVAIDWGLRAFAAAGLASVHAEKVVKIPHWERGEESGEIVAPHPYRLALAALGGSVGTPPSGLEAEVIEVGSLEAVDKLDPASVKGKIVFFDVRMERTRDGAGYGRAVGVRGAGAVRAAKLGAAGVVIRSIGTDNSRLPHTGGMRYDDKVPKIPAAALSIPDAETLHRLLALGTPVRLRMKLGAKTLPDTEGANVVGDVVGSDPSSGLVLLGAHLDSWDLGPGAQDDGAGCAIVIEAGRQINRFPKRPRRTVRIVLFANEENGLAGAKAYAAAHEAELPRHVLAVEADLGAGRILEARFLGDETRRAQFLSIIAPLKALGIEPSSEEAHGGADLIPLIAAGVPALDLRQDASLYFDVHHTANDTVDQIRKEDLDQVAAAYAALAYGAADAEADFGRIPPDKRKSP